MTTAPWYSTAATRVDNETAWIKEENQQIELATAELAAALPDGHLLQTALDAYRDDTPPAGDAEQRIAYLRTGVLLSAAIDAAQNEAELLRPSPVASLEVKQIR